MDGGLIIPIIGKEDGSEMLRNNIKKQLHTIKYFKEILNSDGKINT